MVRFPPHVVSKTVTFTGAAGAGEVDSPIVLFVGDGASTADIFYYVDTELVCANEDTFLADTVEEGDTIGGLNAKIGSRLRDAMQVLPGGYAVTPVDGGDGAAAITGGVMTFYALYRPLSPGATVTPA